jgi:cardiolipin synthase (CMP-forming)
MGSRPERGAVSRAILTLPNAISALRIALIPVFVWLILREGSEAAGIALFAAVSATDWIDGAIARRTGQVTELGAVLDPVADRLAIASGLVALVVAGSFPLWAAVLILVRDAIVLGTGVYALAGKRVRIEVRFVGKIATFGLMVAVPSIGWGREGLPLGDAATAVGWVCFAVAIVEYYWAAVLYAGDLRRALASE